MVRAAEKQGEFYCGERKRANAPRGHISGMSISDMAKELGKRVDARGLSREEMCRLLRCHRWTRSAAGAVPLKNDGENSCFIDSALVALFHRRCDWLDRYVVRSQRVQPQFLKAHQALLPIIQRIRRGMRMGKGYGGLSNSNSNSGNSASNSDLSGGAKKKKKWNSNSNSDINSSSNSDEKALKKAWNAFAPYTFNTNSNSNSDNSTNNKKKGTRTNANSHSHKSYKSNSNGSKSKSNSNSNTNVESESDESSSSSSSESDGEDDGENTCVSLRRLFGSRPFNTFNETHDIDWDGEQQDPIDVLHTLEHMYTLPNPVKVQVKTRGREGIVRDERWALSAYQVPGYMFQDDGVRDWKHVFPKLREETLTTTFIEAPIMYFQLHRYTIEERRGQHQSVKNNKPFVPTSMIATPKGLMTLVSVVIHIGSTTKSGHYTALLKTREGPWVYYNDLNKQLQVAGMHLKQALKYKDGRASGLTDGVGFVYMRNV